jgi:poly-gamma-glutamate capsule biosynthesis protein CapA/YwtB (metallophosphatase superfamily)
MRKLLVLLLVMMLPVTGEAARRRPRSRVKPRTPVQRRAPASSQPTPMPLVAPAAEEEISGFPWRVPAPPIRPTPLDEIVIAAVGDIMLGSTFPDATGEFLPPNDGATLLAEVTPILASADVAFGNLEGPMIDGGTSDKCPPDTVGRCYAFRMPTRYGVYLKTAGLDVLGVANNHATDFGMVGRATTRLVLASLGIQTTGDIGSIAHFLVKGTKIAVVAFATYPTFHNLNELAEARRLVADLAARADIVIVSFHGGAEGAAYQHVPFGAEQFLGENRGDLRTFAHAMVDVGAHLVFGHGPHVVRGMEMYKGRLIAYSLGNFATYGSFNLSGPNGLSLILEVRLGTDGVFRAARIHPVKQEKPGGPIFDREAQVIPLLRELSRADFGATAPQITADGWICSAEAAPTAACQNVGSK